MFDKLWLTIAFKLWFSLHQIDLSCIRKTYDEHYGSLTKDVSSDTKDSFQRLLLKMIDRQQ